MAKIKGVRDRFRLTLLCLAFLIAAGCATSFDPQPMDQAGFLSRAQTQVYDKVTVTVESPRL